MHPRFTKRINDIQRAKQSKEVMKSLDQPEPVELIPTDVINKQIKMLEKRLRLLEDLLIGILEKPKPKKR